MEDQEFKKLFQETWDNNPELGFFGILDKLRNVIDFSELGFKKGQNLTSPKKGEYYTPRRISQFVMEFLDDFTCDRVLDPSANFGELLFPFRGSKREIYGIDPNSNHAQFVSSIFGSNLHWLVKDSLKSVREDIEFSFDVIVSNPPIGLKREKYEIKNVKKGKTYELKESYGNALILESLKKLDEGGVGLFVVPEGFVHIKRNESFFNKLNDFGFYIHAAITVPTEAFSNTSIESLLLIIKKEKVNKVFVGKLTKDFKVRKSLIKNFRNNSEGEEPQLGAFVPRKNFKAVDKLILKREIEKRAKRMGLKPFPVSEITESFRSTMPHSDFEDVPNAIYLSSITSNKPAAKTFEEFEGPKGTAIQLILDEEKVYPDYVVNFLNTKLGEQILKLYSPGSTTGRVPVKNMKEDRPLLKNLGPV